MFTDNKQLGEIERVQSMLEAYAQANQRKMNRQKIVALAVRLLHKSPLYSIGDKIGCQLPFNEEKRFPTRQIFIL
jgi:hypothetical protein